MQRKRLEQDSQIKDDQMVKENASRQLATQLCGQRLKVLADPTRLAVLRLLMLGPCQVHELTEQLQVEQSLMSHHLKILRQAQLVHADRRGKAVVYRLSHQVSSDSGCQSLNLGCCELSFEGSDEPSKKKRSRKTDSSGKKQLGKNP